MAQTQFDFNVPFTKARLEEFADVLMALQRRIGFKVSSRGWCYILENARYINKNQFNKVESAVNRCRREGLLPVDFVAEESARAFSGVETETRGTLTNLLKRNLSDVLEGSYYYTPDWWDGEDVYIQMVVEKIDLKTLFEDVCHQYHIPIANSKGWSSILQRAEYARRFKEAEDRGMRCVLLYCGDHDPDGLRISDTLRNNLEQIQYVWWSDRSHGYNPDDLEIERFGLNYDFIEANNYTWIDNLITGSGMNLASTSHKNHYLPYVQDYLGNYGERKCEANAVVTTPDEARDLCRGAIEDILGDDALARFAERRQAIDDKYQRIIDSLGLKGTIEDILDNTPDDFDPDE